MMPITTEIIAFKIHGRGLFGSTQIQTEWVEVLRKSQNGFLENEDEYANSKNLSTNLQ
jgi:hypothetical protein